MAMNTKGSFEDLIAWQKARVLCREIYEVAQITPLSRDWGLRNQMCRAAVSVMSNIAEGWDRATAADTANFLVIAKSSCAELRSQLFVAFDVGYMNEEKFAELKGKAEEVSRIVTGLRKAFRS